MRYAVISGVLAARSLIEESNYDALWQREFRPAMRAAIVNRALYDAFGARAYRWSPMHCGSIACGYDARYACAV